MKKAHRKLALMYHPDKNQQSKAAESAFREIQEAYEVIDVESTVRCRDQTMRLFHYLRGYGLEY